MNFDHPSDPDREQAHAYISEAVRQGVMLARLDVPAKAEIPAPLKWLAGIGAAIFTALGSAFVLWLASTLSSTKDSTIRIEERQAYLAAAVDEDVKDLKARVAVLESFHRNGGQ